VIETGEFLAFLLGCHAEDLYRDGVADDSPSARTHSLQLWVCEMCAHPVVDWQSVSSKKATTRLESYDETREHERLSVSEAASNSYKNPTVEISKYRNTRKIVLLYVQIFVLCRELRTTDDEQLSKYFFLSSGVVGARRPPFATWLVPPSAFKV
jgi:hypothetical protein